MRTRLYSLCTPCPEGFSFCSEFRSRDFRRAPFALYAPSFAAAREFFGDYFPRLAGIILVPGEHLSSLTSTPILSTITVSPAMLHYLQDFAMHQLKQLDELLASREKGSYLELENERLSVSGQRTSEEFETFRASLMREIEERRAAERNLAESEERLRLIMSSSGDAIFGIDTLGICTFANEACLRLLGYEHIGEMLGCKIHDLIHRRAPDGSPIPLQECRILKTCLEGHGVSVSDEVFWRRDGSFFPVEYSSYPIRKDDQIIGTVVTWRDISQRRRAEAALQESELKFRTLFTTIQDAIYLTRADDGQIVECNDKLSGYSRNELIGRTTAELSLWADMNQRQQVVDLVMANGFVNDFQATFKRKDGTLFSGSISTNIISLHDGTFLLSVIRDISDRKRSEEELRETRELFTLFMKYTPVYTFIKQIEGDQSRVIQISDNFIDMVGKPAEELRGRTMYELFPDDFARKITDDDIAVVNAGKILQIDEDLNGRNYTTIKFPIIRENRNNLIAGFTIDITERKRSEEERQNMEKQLLNTQKMESLGVLAGGIAHDFNNILMAIMGNAELAMKRLGNESPAAENLRRIEQSAARAADLAKQMLAYSGKGKFIVESINLNSLLEEMQHILKVAVSNKALLRFNTQQQLPMVEADPAQMRQIIMNLVTNASEALGDECGEITITTGCMECDRSYLKDMWLDENLVNGLYVYLEVTDTGCGMDNEMLPKLFEPFFTTKFTGRGLGMAAVLGIVRGHKGAIKVYSDPGNGTTFKVLLPAADKTFKLPDESSKKIDHNETGTVLLVDDEESVRGIGVEMLKELGFAAITANDGMEAISIFRQHPDICFVILDLTMPNMDGEQCFRELRRLEPDVKVILSSGYSKQEISERFSAKGLAGIIQKPYRLSALREIIQKISE